MHTHTHTYTHTYTYTLCRLKQFQDTRCVPGLIINTAWLATIYGYVAHSHMGEFSLLKFTNPNTVAELV